MKPIDRISVSLHLEGEKYPVGMASGSLRRLTILHSHFLHMATIVQ
jgi:hypothetical protein